MNTLTLDQQREAFCRRRFLATPLAGLIIWAMIGIAGVFLPVFYASWVMFIGTGSIIYLAMFLGRFTGESFINQAKEKNSFDNLFFRTVVSSFLIFAIAIPFFMQDHSSLPLTLGVLTGTMWLPLSWIIRHWVGTFHAVTRTGLIVLLWYLFPDARFVAIPAVIVLIYIISIIALEKRWRNLNSTTEINP